MITKLAKTKELVFRKPNLFLDILPPVPDSIDRVEAIKLLGVYFQTNLNFDSRLNFISSKCSQHLCPMKFLRDQGLNRTHLDTVFQILCLSRHLCSTILEWILKVWVTAELIPFVKGLLNMVLLEMFVVLMISWRSMIYSYLKLSNIVTVA